jgi:solute carrier family 25 oxoglutarate transporter 11
MSGGWVENVKPFVIGGISGCTATFSIHPIDTVKVRIQVRGEEAGMAAKEGKKVNTSVFGVVKEVYVNDGALGFYKG